MSDQDNKERSQTGLLDRWSARKRKVKQITELDTDAVFAGSTINLDSNDASPLAPFAPVGQEEDVSGSDLSISGDAKHSDAQQNDAHQNQAPISTDDSADEQAPLLSDADMPSIETLTAKSDLSDFFNRGVSAGLRRAALRHVFQLPVYNERDGLNDYDDDFTKFEPLGDTVTSDMKWHKARKEREAEEAAAKLREEEQAQRKLDETEAKSAKEASDEQGDDQATENQSEQSTEQAVEDQNKASETADDAESESQPDALEPLETQELEKQKLEKQKLETVPSAHANNAEAVTDTEGTPS